VRTVGFNLYGDSRGIFHCLRVYQTVAEKAIEKSELAMDRRMSI
jgi:hypothetical protein